MKRTGRRVGALWLCLGLCLATAGSASAAFEFDITSQVTSLSDGWYLYEYAVRVVENVNPITGLAYSPSMWYVDVSKGAKVLFNDPSRGLTANRAPTLADYMILDGNGWNESDSALSKPPEWAPYDQYTFGYFWKDGKTWTNSVDGQSYARWDLFTHSNDDMDGDGVVEAQETNGLAGYFAFVSDHGPALRPWYLHNHEVVTQGYAYAPTPEPAAAFLLLLGAIPVALLRRRRARA